MIIRDRRIKWEGMALAGVGSMAVIFAAIAPGFFASVALAAPQQDAPEFADSPIYTWLQRNKTAAYWAAPLLMVVVAILPIPAEIPAAMNGMLFGAVVGVVITWSGAMVGAMISYELARCFGQRLVRRFVKAEAMQKLEGLKDTEAPVLLMLRLTPVVAFTVVNWASGLLQVHRPTFVWTTAVGILPGVIAFTASGSAVARVYERYPTAVTAVVATLCGALLFRAWWKQRDVPTR